MEKLVQKSKKTEFILWLENLPNETKRKIKNLSFNTLKSLFLASVLIIPSTINLVEQQNNLTSDQQIQRLVKNGQNLLKILEKS